MRKGFEKNTGIINLEAEKAKKETFKRTNKLLISESPLQILPSLAVKIGLNEAVMLQQVHYWISNPLNNNLRQGRIWVYKTHAQWRQEFPFWSLMTIRRTIVSLEEKKLLFSNNSFNRMSSDRTKWYSIDYDQLELIDNSLDIGTCVQNEHMDCSKRTHGLFKMNTCTIPENTTEITTENNNNNQKTVIKSTNSIRSETDSSVVVFLMEKLKHLAISKVLVTTWLKQYGANYIVEKVELTKTSNAKNPEGYLNQAIANDWKPTLPKQSGSCEIKHSEPVYPTHEENVMWYKSLSDKEKSKYLQMALHKQSIFEEHLKNQKISALDSNFFDHNLFKMLMSLIGRAK